MSGELLSIGLDILVIVLLGVTIYYALKLSRSLNNFRAYRKEFNGLISELGRNIEDAHKVIEKMKTSGSKSGSDLEAVLKESKFLADELQLINEAGNSLAGRLEGLAEKNRRIAQGLEDEDEYDEQLYKHVEQMEAGLSGGRQGGAGGPFAIQDRDFGENEKDDDGATGLQSQAEQELFKAIQKHKKRATH